MVRPHPAPLRRQLKAHLSHETLRDLHRISPARHFAVALRLVVVMALCTAALVQSRWTWLWAPAILLQGFNILATTILLHEQVHDCIWRGRPRLNALLGQLYALPSGICPTQFRRWHLDHHDHLGSDTADPKRANLSPKVNSRLLKLAYFTPALFVIYARASKRAAAVYPAAMQRRIRAERLLAVGCHLLLLIGLVVTGDWGLALRVHLAPLLLGFPVAFAINRLGQHYDIQPGDPARGTTRLDGNPVWRWLFLWSNHHLEHHLYPRVPFYNLSRLGTALRPFYDEERIESRSYRGLLWQWLVRNRTAHTDWGAPSTPALLAITRPFTLLPPFLGIVSGAMAALGSLVARGEVGLLDGLVTHGRLILLGGVVAAILNAASNVLNQVTEIEVDRINKPDRMLPAGRLSPRAALAWSVVLYGLAIGLAWQITPEPGLRPTFWCVVAAAFATVIYTVKPIYTKARGWWANVTIAIPRGCLLKVAGWGCVANVADPEPWFIGSVFALFLLGAATSKDYADLDGDRAMGINTLPVMLGVERAAAVTAPLYSLPWLLLPLGLLPLSGGAILHTAVVPTVALSLGLTVYGAWVARLMRAPDARGAENHPGWRHMYQLMMFAQVGLIACYLL